jgi:hypothetical protein
VRARAAWVAVGADLALALGGLIPLFVEIHAAVRMGRGLAAVDEPIFGPSLFFENVFVDDFAVHPDSKPTKLDHAFVKVCQFSVKKAEHGSWFTGSDKSPDEEEVSIPFRERFLQRVDCQGYTGPLRESVCWRLPIVLDDNSSPWQALAVRFDDCAALQRYCSVAYGRANVRTAARWVARAACGSAIRSEAEPSLRMHGRMQESVRRDAREQ